MSRLSSATVPKAAPSVKRPWAAPVTDPDPLPAKLPLGVRPTTANSNTSRVTPISRFMIFSLLSMQLDVAPTERSARRVAVTHDNRKGIDILPGFTVVTDGHIEPKRA